MIFSKLARLVAIVLCVVGLMCLAVGAYAMIGLMGPDEVARYIGSSPGKLFDRGVYTALFAVVLGTLAEINFSIRKAIEAAE